ncbi:hypothetical protein K1719_043867 [Acacia pycnantha]|nr:hypothetical protein K1719_043867 [Acacia pycnantha]
MESFLDYLVVVRSSARKRRRSASSGHLPSPVERKFGLNAAAPKASTAKSEGWGETRWLLHPSASSAACSPAHPGLTNLPVRAGRAWSRRAWNGLLPPVARAPDLFREDEREVRACMTICAPSGSGDGQERPRGLRRKQAVEAAKPIPKPYGSDTSTLTNKSIRLPYLDLEERLACLLFRRIQQSKKSKFLTTTSISVPISSLYLFLRSVLRPAFKILPFRSTLVNSREVESENSNSTLQGILVVSMFYHGYMDGMTLPKTKKGIP